MRVSVVQIRPWAPPLSRKLLFLNTYSGFCVTFLSDICVTLHKIRLRCFLPHFECFERCLEPTVFFGIFNKDYALAAIGDGVGVGSNDPRFICRTSDVSSAANGDAIVVNSVTYTVRNVEDDGTGITTLVLEA